MNPTKLVPFMIVLLCSAKSAMADSRMYPASTCYPLDPVEATYNYGYSNLSTTSSATIICPLVRLQDTSPWTSITASLYDRNSSSEVSCEVWTSNRDGTGGVFTPIASSGNSASVQNVSVTASNSWANATSQVVIKCIIPPYTGSGASHVVGFSVSD